MSYEEERLAILQRVSRGELSPQDGQLEIAMLKVRHQQAEQPQEPGLAQARPARENPFEGGPFGQLPYGQALPRLNLRGPLALAILLPVVLIGGIMLTGLGLFLALPTYLLVNVYNQAAATHPGWPMLGFWPTLFGLMALFSLVSLLNWGRKIRAAFQRQSSVPFGEQ